MARECDVDVKDRRKAVVARRIGVSEPTLYRWRGEFLAAGKAALAKCSSNKQGAYPRDNRITELEHQIENRYSATETAYPLKLARTEAKRIHGALVQRQFLESDIGSSFIARRFVADQYSYVQIQYHRPQHMRECLAEFRVRYNERRPHRALVPV